MIARPAGSAGLLALLRLKVPLQALGWSVEDVHRLACPWAYDSSHLFGTRVFLMQPCRGVLPVPGGKLQLGRMSLHVVLPSASGSHLPQPATADMLAGLIGCDPRGSWLGDVHCTPGHDACAGHNACGIGHAGLDDQQQGCMSRLPTLCWQPLHSAPAMPAASRGPMQMPPAHTCMPVHAARFCHSTFATTGLLAAHQLVNPPSQHACPVRVPNVSDAHFAPWLSQRMTAPASCCRRAHMGAGSMDRCLKSHLCRANT